MPLFFVAYDDGRDNVDMDWFVSAPTAFEAFVAWREAHVEGEPSDMDADEVRVFRVPTHCEGICVHDWPHDTVTVFPLDLDTLATRSIIATLRQE